VRRVLKDLSGKGDLKCIGKGPGAPWLKKGNMSE